MPPLLKRFQKTILLPIAFKQGLHNVKMQPTRNKNVPTTFSFVFLLAGRQPSPTSYTVVIKFALMKSKDAGFPRNSCLWRNILLLQIPIKELAKQLTSKTTFHENQSSSSGVIISYLEKRLNKHRLQKQYQRFAVPVIKRAVGWYTWSNETFEPRANFTRMARIW